MQGVVACGSLAQAINGLAGAKKGLLRGKAPSPGQATPAVFARRATWKTGAGEMRQ